MNNKNSDLRNVLFEMIERINDDDLTPEELEQEIAKAKSINSLSKTILQSAKLEANFLRQSGSTGSSSFLELGAKE